MHESRRCSLAPQSLSASAGSVTRSSYRRKVLRKDPEPAQPDAFADRIYSDWDDNLGGRIMRAAVAVGPRELLSSEVPVVRGRCRTVGCPGCNDMPCIGRFGCVWASHVVKSARLRNAVAWHAQLCKNAEAIPEESVNEKVNFVRAVCLLAITIQACASDELWEWLMTKLRPATDDTSHPLRVSTASFGMRFGNAIPPPPSNAGVPTSTRKPDEPFNHQWFSIGDPVGGSGGAAVTSAAREEWHRQLTELLLRLQTNLFYLDDNSIGIFPLACQLEHSCNPNATVEGSGIDGELVVRSGPGRVIGKGERVSFCYMPDGGDDFGDRVPLRERRARTLSELGFWCRCQKCDADEDIERQAGRLEGLAPPCGNALKRAISERPPPQIRA